MPIKRRKAIARHPSELLPIEWAYLRDDPEPDDAEFGVWWSLRRGDDAFRPGRPSVESMWRELGAGITAEHAAAWPGSRPNCWWQFNAPEARRRVGGVGEAGRTDRLAYGRPVSWAWPVNWPPGATVIGGPRECDPSDPPIYESEATYLLRLDLLLPGEIELLTAENFEPDPIKR